MNQAEIDAYNYMAATFCVTDRMNRIRAQTTARLIAVREAAYTEWALRQVDPS